MLRGRPARDCSLQLLSAWYAVEQAYSIAKLNSVQEQKFRTERDTFGELQVPADRYWGAQTQR